ncbi:MAG: 16S rRNA (cytidine(1402)-2'-O)-methyltransferase [Leptospirales bacterium]
MYKHDTGALYVVSTPIGNLDDITVRALRILRSVSLVAAEDTRVTRVLLDRHGIETPVVSYHAHNAEEKAPLLVSRMKEGQSIALVSDAGTPLVSDPGTVLVQSTIEAGLPVHPVPGPSALLASLVVSGLGTDHFLFGGFLPRKEREIRTRLESLATLDATLVFFESPRRIGKTIRIMADTWGDRPAVLCREMTKMFETVERGSLYFFRDQGIRQPEKGEWTILVAGETGGTTSLFSRDLLSCRNALEELLIPKTRQARFMARLTGIPKAEAYRLLFPNEKPDHPED